MATHSSHRINYINKLEEKQAEVKYFELLEKKLVGISTARYVPGVAMLNVHEQLVNAEAELRQLNKNVFVRISNKIIRK